MNRFKKKESKFTQISNQVLLDNELSLKAKGLYSIIQHYITIPDFVLYLNTLKKATMEGKHSFNSAWKELKTKGYLIQEKKRDSKTGKFFYEYELLDEPHAENPHAEKPVGGKLGLYNDTDSINTDSINTKIKKDYREQETCTRQTFPVIIENSKLTGDIQIKKQMVKLFFGRYKNVTKYDKHFDINKWDSINEAMDYIIDFSDNTDCDCGINNLYYDLLDENFNITSKKGYYSLQGFLNKNRIAYLLSKIGLIDENCLYEYTGEFYINKL